MDPTDRIKGGSWFAYVGGVDRLGGLKVRDWPGDELHFVGVMRLVVAVEQVNQALGMERERVLAAA